MIADVREKMRAFHCILLFCVSLNCLRADEARSAPIIVKLDRESLLRPEINGKQMTLPEVKGFFSEASEKLGRKDPIIIQLDKNQGMDIAILLAKIAFQSHDAVFFEVSGSEPEGIKYILEIPKDGIKTIIDKQKGERGPLNIPNGNPNYQRDRQIKHLQNLQQEIIE